MDSSFFNTENINQLVKQEIINVIFSYWEKIPNSELQDLANQVNFDKAVKHWENVARAFFQKYQMTDSEIEINWNDKLWKGFRSIPITVNRLGTFHFPYTCFRFQTIKSTSFNLLQTKMQEKKPQTISQFIELIWDLARNLFADLNEDEVEILKKSIQGLDNDHFQNSGWLAPFYFTTTTDLSAERISKSLSRLMAIGVFQPQIIMNYGRIGLYPKLLITQRSLESLENEYSFFQVSPADKIFNYNGIAVPPQAIELGWTDQLLETEILQDIRSFTCGWNLTQLTIDGWGNYPKILPEASALGQTTIKYNIQPLDLRTADTIYLEKIYWMDGRVLRGERGQRAQSQVRKLRKEGAFRWNCSYRSLGLSASIFIYAKGKQDHLQKINLKSKGFPLFRHFENEDWILSILTMPEPWIYRALLDLKELCTELPLESLNIDIHQGAIERFLPLASLWDRKQNEWIAA